MGTNASKPRPSPHSRPRSLSQIIGFRRSNNSIRSNKSFHISVDAPPPPPPSTLQEEWLLGRRCYFSLSSLVPLDPEEMDRCDIDHFVLKKLLERNFSVVLDNPKRILDVGAGSGKWLKEVAEMFPKAKLWGLDIMDDLFNTNCVPKNCTFQVADVSNGIPFKDNYFSFVHQRCMLSSIPSSHWPNLLKELYRVTKLDGWIQLVEVNPEILPKAHHVPAIQTLNSIVLELQVNRGFNRSTFEDLSRLLIKSGFLQVHEQIIRLPLGAWGGELGYLSLKSALKYYEGLFVLSGCLVKFSKETMQRLVSQALDVECERIQAYLEVKIITARKQQH